MTIRSGPQEVGEAIRGRALSPLNNRIASTPEQNDRHPPDTNPTVDPGADPTTDPGTDAARVRAACEALAGAGTDITFTAAAAEAGIGRATCYRRRDLRAIIDGYRSRHGELLTLTGLADRVDNLTQALDAVAAKVRRQEEESARSNTAKQHQLPGRRESRPPISRIIHEHDVQIKIEEVRDRSERLRGDLTDGVEQEVHRRVRGVVGEPRAAGDRDPLRDPAGRGQFDPGSHARWQTSANTTPPPARRPGAADRDPADRRTDSEAFPAPVQRPRRTQPAGVQHLNPTAGLTGAHGGRRGDCLLRGQERGRA